MSVEQSEVNEMLSDKCAELRGALRLCLAAMTRSLDEGSTDHLDASEDGGAYWWEARKAALEALK